MQSTLSHFKVYNLVLLVICTWACRAHVAFSLCPVMRCWFESSDHFYTQPPDKTIFTHIPNIGPPSDQSFTNISHSLWFVFTFYRKSSFVKMVSILRILFFLCGLYLSYYTLNTFFFLPNTKAQRFFSQAAFFWQFYNFTFLFIIPCSFLKKLVHCTVKDVG